MQIRLRTAANRSSAAMPRSATNTERIKSLCGAKPPQKLPLDEREVLCSG
jgi:hypothetical protein